MRILKHSESGPPWHVPAKTFGEPHNPAGGGGVASGDGAGGAGAGAAGNLAVSFGIGRRDACDVTAYDNDPFAAQRENSATTGFGAA
jgi:hypothetical protein